AKYTSMALRGWARLFIPTHHLSVLAINRSTPSLPKPLVMSPALRDSARPLSNFQKTSQVADFPSRFLPLPVETTCHTVTNGLPLESWLPSGWAGLFIPSSANVAAQKKNKLN